MDVSTNATVQAADGVAGRISRLLVQPGTNTVTQLVVELPNGAEVIVPADYVTDSNARRVRVNLTRQQLAGMTPYTPPARRRRQPSAFESLFSGSPFEDFFGDAGFGDLAFPSIGGANGQQSRSRGPRGSSRLDMPSRYCRRAKWCRRSAGEYPNFARRRG